MTLYIPSEKMWLDENLKLTSVSADPFCFISSEIQGKYYLEVNNKVLSMDQEIVLLPKKDNRGILFEDVNFSLKHGNKYLDYYDGRIILSSNPGIVFVEDLSSIYCDNKIATRNIGFGSNLYQFLPRLEKSVEIFAKSTGFEYNKKAKIDKSLTYIQNLIIDKKYFKNVVHRIEFDNCVFEWWFESLLQFSGHKEELEIDDLNNEALEIISKCTDKDTLNEVLSGLNNPFFINDKGETSLIIAIKNNLNRTALKLIKTDENLEEIDDEGNTALSLCIEKQNIDLLRELVGCRINQFMFKKIIEMNNVEIFRKFFEKDLVTQEIETYCYENCSVYMIKEMIKKKRYFTNKQHLKFSETPINEMPEEAIICFLINDLFKQAEEMLDKGIGLNYIFKEYPIEKFCSNPKLLVKIIEMKTNLNISDNIEVFSKENFTLIKEITEGTYGKITLEKNKIDQKDYVIKTSLNCGHSEIIDNFFCKEILILRKINEKDPDMSCKLQGVMLNKYRCVIMVLEDAGINFPDYLESLSEEEKDLKFKEFFREIFHQLETLQSLGLVHHDLHEKNVMVKNGKPKIIDYGISLYKEIYFTRGNVHQWALRPWIPPDTSSYNNYLKKIIKRDYVMPEELDDFNGINYTFDVFSVGVLMCNWIFNEKDVFYIYGKRRSLRKYKDNFNSLATHQKIDNDDDLNELLKGILHHDSAKRFGVSEVLSSNFFGEKREINKIDKELQLRDYTTEKNIDIVQVQKMVNNYKECDVRILNNLDVSKRLYVNALFGGISHNTLYNSLFIQFENTNNYPDHNVPVIIAGTFFNRYYYCPDDLTSKMKKDIEKQVYSDIINLKINPRPVTLFFIYLNLMYSAENLFETFHLQFSTFLLKVDFQFNIWNVVCVIFSEITGIRNDELDLSNYEKISSCLM